MLATFRRKIGDCAPLCILVHRGKAMREGLIPATGFSSHPYTSLPVASDTALTPFNRAYRARPEKGYLCNRLTGSKALNWGVTSWLPEAFAAYRFRYGFPKGLLLGVLCSKDDASWGWTSNLPSITHLASCPNRKRPTISSDE